MNIVMLLPNLDECGPFIVAENIVRYITDKDFRFSFISLRKNSELNKKRCLERGFKFFEIGMRKTPTMKDLKKLEKLMETLKIDIIHAHCFWPTVLCSFLPKKYIKFTTLHNNPAEDFSFTYGRFIGNLMSMVMVKCLHQYNSIIAISKYVKDIHENLGVKKEITIIYNGIEDRNKNFIDKNDINLKTELIIVTLAGLNKRKNHETALNAIKILNNLDIDVKYMIIGKGSQENHLKNLCFDLGISDSVNFIGSVENYKVGDYLKNADVFLFPSRSEGFGLAVVEAMMFGVPVICSDIPVMKEIVRESYSGFLCEVNNAYDYANKIINCVNNNLFGYLSDNARKTYMEKFLVQDMSNQYRISYRKAYKDCNL